jgi:hypothetical protein
MSSNNIHNRLHSVKDNIGTQLYEGITWEYPDKLYKTYEPYIPIKLGEVRKIRQNLKAKTKRLQTELSNTESSAQKAKTRIRNYVYSNSFDLFATFTFSTARDDQALCMHKMHSWLKNWQRRHEKCKYLCVHEFHQDGVSLHFHVLFENFTGKLKKAINPHTGNDLKQHGKLVYTIPSFKHGFTNAIMYNGSPESRRKLSGYLCKYIVKDIPEFFNKKRYWNSKNLSLPNKKYGLPEWYRQVQPIWTKELEFGRQSWFQLDDSGGNEVS